MARVVGIRFKTAGKVYYFDPGEFALAPGDGAVVETARGVELGTVTSLPREVPDEEIKAPLKKVLRKATADDLAKRRENEEKARRAFGVGQQKIALHGLPMKLVEVEYTLDGSKIIFYFTAENRVDFRDLVKDLASTFRTRIELRQIGVRDEAKLLGGLGPCGRQLCCQAFLGDFVPVSIRMAKEQNLSLNPTKISGICGRLMCCLNFESEAYREAKRAAAAAQARPAEGPEPPGETPRPALETAEETAGVPEKAAETIAPGGHCPMAPGPVPEAPEGPATEAPAKQGGRRRRRRRPRPNTAQVNQPPAEPRPNGQQQERKGPDRPGHRRRRRKTRSGASEGAPGNPAGSPAE